MIHKSTSLKYEPSLELLRVTAELLFSNRELYRSVQLSVGEFSHLLYTNGWVLAGGLSHYHHRYHYHTTQGFAAIPTGALEAGIRVLRVNVSVGPRAVQDDVSVGSSAW